MYIRYRQFNSHYYLIADCLSFLSFSSGVVDGISRKDELYNMLVDDFMRRGVDWPRSTAPTDGAYFIQVHSYLIWHTCYYMR